MRCRHRQRPPSPAAIVNSLCKCELGEEEEEEERSFAFNPQWVCRLPAFARRRPSISFSHSLAP